MADRYMKRCSTSLIIREMQIKTTRDITSHQLAWPTSKSQTIRNAYKDVEKRGILLHCWWECKLVQPLLEAICRFPKILKIETPFDPVIPLLGIYPKNAATQFEKDIWTPMFITSLFTIAKKWKQPKCPSVDEWIKM